MSAAETEAEDKTRLEEPSLAADTEKRKHAADERKLAHITGVKEITGASSSMRDLPQSLKVTPTRICQTTKLKIPLVFHTCTQIKKKDPISEFHTY